MKDRIEDSKAKETQTHSPNSGDRLRVIIVGGSIPGLWCARALLNSGVCLVVVLEKAKSLSETNAALYREADCDLMPTLAKLIKENPILPHLASTQHYGQLKQGIILDPAQTFPWRLNDKIAAERLLIKHMDSF